MGKAKPNKERIFDKNQPNIHEIGEPTKQKQRCYYCNERCTTEHKIESGKRIKYICGVCFRGTR